MRAIVLAAPGRLELKEVPTPEPGPGQVRIRTAACGLCATDLAMIDGDPRVGPRAILGHEWAGTVDAVGPRADPAMCGRLCVAENVLADGTEVGFEHPGGYGEFFITEAKNVYLLPEGFDPALAALIEPLAVGVRGMRRLAADARQPAVVFGDGPLGLMMLMLLRRAGVADVTVVGGRPARLKVALELGAARTVNYHEVSFDLASAVLGLACGSGHCPLERGYRTIVEASGSPAAIDAALALAAPDARVLVLGDYGQAVATFRWNHLLHRELVLIGSNASRGAWAEAVRLATSCDLPLGRLVTARYAAERFAEAFDRARRRTGDDIKIILEW